MRSQMAAESFHSRRRVFTRIGDIKLYCALESWDPHAQATLRGAAVGSSQPPSNLR
jgi:hypothetical protein